MMQISYLYFIIQLVSQKNLYFYKVTNLNFLDKILNENNFFFIQKKDTYEAADLMLNIQNMILMNYLQLNIV
jgi:hypothetical protein